MRKTNWRAEAVESVGQALARDLSQKIGVKISWSDIKNNTEDGVVKVVKTWLPCDEPEDLESFQLKNPGWIIDEDPMEAHYPMFGFAKIECHLVLPAEINLNDLDGVIDTEMNNIMGATLNVTIANASGTSRGWQRD